MSLQRVEDGLRGQFGFLVFLLRNFVVPRGVVLLRDDDGARQFLTSSQCARDVDIACARRLALVDSRVDIVMATVFPFVYSVDEYPVGAGGYLHILHHLILVEFEYLEGVTTVEVDAVAVGFQVWHAVAKVEIYPGILISVRLVGNISLRDNLRGLAVAYHLIGVVADEVAPLLAIVAIKGRIVFQSVCCLEILQVVRAACGLLVLYLFAIPVFRGPVPIEQPRHGAAVELVMTHRLIVLRVDVDIHVP